MNEISENVIQLPSDRVIITRAATVNQKDDLNTLTQHIAYLDKIFESFQMNTQQSSQAEVCDMCGGNHLNHECDSLA
ncbi:hypothetical protein RND71_016456 [Anisodus tanguticus]|uniref:Uncharacterized protein n=1 Tax=Anisodus tanguticus TaxID=243964 RepID=A0AAE1S7A8_9SOLA|nr:hypothetical protein RND71_016456 [Anisodus tanguticus]